MSKNWYPIFNYELCTACLCKCSPGMYAYKDVRIVVVTPIGCSKGYHGC